MKTLPVLVLSLTLLTVFSETSPILTEKQAKQLLRSRRRDRPSKPGFPDEPMRPPTWRKESEEIKTHFPYTPSSLVQEHLRLSLMLGHFNSANTIVEFVVFSRFAICLLI
ncbi:uncharacterized protein C17orf67 homolog isoform X3 [Pongo pygmaeus]|uniref:uncharacterized protein C17orf67 homolog isoform X3 n=1 Tax=Pongo pygmaeus TaxID=9600 RepID=UPI0023E1B881|nr:uncharacterized protein C17orf67 homolog isoform X1 [Pongo pygmaeus]